MKTVDLLSYHPGRQHNLEQAIQLQKQFASFRHLTSLYFDKSVTQTCTALSQKLGAGLNKRSSELGADVVDTYPLPELMLLLKRALGYKVGTPDYIKRNKVFQEWMLRRYAPPKVCIGYDTASWLAFEKWKGKSFLILDLSIAVPQYKLTLTKQGKFGEGFIANQTKDDINFYEIYAKELELADMVLCGSSFVRDSCLALDADPAKLMVLPYGADLKKFCVLDATSKKTDIIKVAFVGSVNYRKGADVLLKAWQRIATTFSHVELHFYGNVQMDVPDMENVFYHGFLDQGDLIAELRTAHISVLPTFFEGSSLAVYQSMAMGLAVITTPNAGSIIEDTKNGLLIPYGSVEHLFHALFQLITEPDRRRALALQALEDIKQYTWDTYGEKLSALLQARIV